MAGRFQSESVVGFDRIMHFDCGVANAILERFALGLSSPERGLALECFIHSQLAAWCASPNVLGKLYYWRTQDKKEVDFIVTQERTPKMAIEVKLAEQVNISDTSGLKAFQDEYPFCRAIVVALCARKLVLPNGIEVLPVVEFLESLWSSFHLIDLLAAESLA